MSQPPLSGGRYQEVDHEFLLAAGDMDVTDVPCPHSSDRRRTRAGLVGLSGGRGSARTAGVDVDRRHPELRFALRSGPSRVPAGSAVPLSASADRWSGRACDVVAELPVVMAQTRSTRFEVVPLWAYFAERDALCARIPVGAPG